MTNVFGWRTGWECRGAGGAAPRCWSGCGRDWNKLIFDEPALEHRLRRHVHALAGTIGERNVWRPDALHAAADYIRSAFGSAGCEVVPPSLLNSSSRSSEIRSITQRTGLRCIDGLCCASAKRGSKSIS
jgi:hypothetical protein